MFSSKQSKMKYYRQCKPPYSTYGEILQLERCEKDEHFEIAHRAKKYILKLPQLLSFNRPDLPRIVFYLAYRHATSLEHYLFIIKSNVNYGICTRYSIYDVLSRFNHSCDPNIDHTIDEEGFISCTTNKPIKKGEQIFMNYLGDEKFSTTQQRFRYLKEVWNFDCSCKKCSSI